MFTMLQMLIKMNESQNYEICVLRQEKVKVDDFLIVQNFAGQDFGIRICGIPIFKLQFQISSFYSETIRTF